MKYRIKIITYANGRKSYCPQVKEGLFWFGLSYDGSSDMFAFKVDSREGALDRIDKHFSGNTKKQTITFEYINR